MAEGSIMETVDVGRAIEWQADHAERSGAPITARIVRAQLAILAIEGKLPKRMREWPGLSLEDAMPLRVAAGFHWLHLTGREPRLAPVYSGAVSDQRQVDRVMAAVAQDHDALLEPWLDSPPQTNEAGRSSSVMAGLLWLAARLGPRFELIEIGASAAVNTMIERYHYDLDGITVGPLASPMQLVPEWRGAPPPPAAVEIMSIRGCDIAPIDLADPSQVARLRAYVWTDAPERMERIEAAAQLAGQAPPRLEKMDAGEFVAARLAEPQAAGVTRVLYHTVMWQYLPPATRAQITAAMTGSGERATPDRPLAWIALETNRETFRHELTVRLWPGGGEPVVLAEAHPHGAWIEWRG